MLWWHHARNHANTLKFLCFSMQSLILKHALIATTAACTVLHSLVSLQAGSEALKGPTSDNKADV